MIREITAIQRTQKGIATELVSDKKEAEKISQRCAFT